ncbi:MAG: urea carboxylase-associated family protein [Gammaproteobacteria bacterium]|nr:urea carboxylase-associated family protein [Gammaproteobacteria bacterium]
MSTSPVLYQDTLVGGCHWSLRMRRGTTLRLIDLDGDANVGMLFYNPENLLERYNAPDTLKCQHTFKLAKGNCLYSDMGRIFCSVTADSLGWHETVCGNSTAAIVNKKWGNHTYQDYRNDRHQNGYDSFLVELAKYGLGKRDLASNINFFSKVYTDSDGNLHYVTKHSHAGDYVELRFEMDSLVILHTCPHPLNPAKDYPRKPIRYEIHRSTPVTDLDFCKNFCPENRRGFENNRIYHLGHGNPSHD